LIGEVCRISRDYDGHRSSLAPAWKILESSNQGEREPSGTTLSVPLRLVFSPSVFVCVELNPKRILSVGSLLDAGLDVLHMEGATRVMEQSRLHRPRIQLVEHQLQILQDKRKPPYEGTESVVARVARIRFIGPSLANPLATGMQKADPLFGIGL
jgi:hypothetical protein